MSVTALMVIAIIGTLTVTFWPRVLEWARDSLFPWLRKNSPRFAELAEQALVWVDKTVCAMRVRAGEAWQNLRKVLLRMVVYIERNTSGGWIRRVVSTIKRVLDNGETKFVEVTSSKEVDWADLPDEIREQILRSGAQKVKVNVSDERDAELAV